MKAKLGWSFRPTTTTTTKLPPNWEDQGTKMVHKVTYLVKAYNVPALIVINMDQTRIHLVPTCGEKYGERKDQNTYMFLGLKIRGKLLL
jgi:hypothetical protein